MFIKSIFLASFCCFLAHSYQIRPTLNKLRTPLRSQKDEEAVIDFIWKSVDSIPPFKGKVTDKSSLKIKELSGGNTNFNYVVHNTDGNSKKLASVFVKHAKPYAKGFGESAPMSTVRLGYEFYGVNEFSKYGFTTLDAYIYDAEQCYLVTQFLDGYEPLVTSLQNGEVDVEVAKAVGAIMGNCHADTHDQVVTPEVSQGYAAKYTNKEHFDLWDKHFFPMSLTRLADTRLIKQTPDIAPFGEEHYSSVRSFLESDFVGEKTRNVLAKAIEEVRNFYLKKKTTLIHADLHSNNIMIRKDNFHPHRLRFQLENNFVIDSSNNEEDGKQSCDLTKVRMIDFEKFAYGPPGVDLGQYMANYIYFMPLATHLPVTEWQQTSLVNLRPDELYDKFEDTLRSFWVAYVEAFDMHTEQMSKRYGPVMTPQTRNAILQENFRDAIGFIGWWMFSLVASCPVDVMPIPRPLVRATAQKKPITVASSRILQLKIAIAALKTFHLNETLDTSSDNRFWVENILKMVKKVVFSDNWCVENRQ